jgi:hypothetical protein
MKNKQKGFTALELMFTVIATVAAIGYVWNIARLVGDIQAVNQNLLMIILRVIGIFTGIGVFLGYIPG